MVNSKIFVLGSMNMDLVVKSKYIPQSGETMHGDKFFMNPGGKGANQAVALAKNEEEVVMIGCVGQDAMGKQLIESLKEVSVHTQFIEERNTNTGVAVILVDEKDNRIILEAGANYQLEDNQIENALTFATENDYFLTQLETNWEAIEKGIKMAKQKNMQVVFNPAPVTSIDLNILYDVDFLIVNEIECQMLLNCTSKETQKIQTFLNQYKITYCIITLGDKGVDVYTSQTMKHYAAYQITPVDTTAAGDTFIGAFLSEWIRTQKMDQSIVYATAASALTCLSLGAQQSIKNRKEVESFLERK